MKTIASLSLLLLTASLFAASTTTTTTVIVPPTKPVVVTPKVNKKPEVQHKCDDKNKSVVKVAPVTKSGTCDKK